MTYSPKKSRLLAALRRRLRGVVAIAGVGNVLRADDGAGPRFVQMFRERLDTHTDLTSLIHLINCGTTPENYIGSICRIRPDTVLVVDSGSAEDLVPGEIRIAKTDELFGQVFTTHALSPALFMRRLKEESGADVFLAAVQPATCAFGQRLSDAVSRSLVNLCDALEEVIRWEPYWATRQSTAASRSPRGNVVRAMTPQSHARGSRVLAPRKGKFSANLRSRGVHKKRRNRSVKTPVVAVSQEV